MRQILVYVGLRLICTVDRLSVKSLQKESALLVFCPSLNQQEGLKAGDGRENPQREHTKLEMRPPRATNRRQDRHIPDTEGIGEPRSLAPSISLARLRRRSSRWRVGIFRCMWVADAAAQPGHSRSDRFSPFLRFFQDGGPSFRNGGALASRLPAFPHRLGPELKASWGFLGQPVFPGA